MKFCPFCGGVTEENEKFCSFCGSSLQSEEKATFQNERESNRYSSTDNSGVCPSCGMVLSAYDAICPGCGREINSHRGSAACRELIEKLDRIEMSRPHANAPSNFDTLVSVFASNIVSSNYKSPAEKENERIDELIRKQKFECISHFIVPNNKEDIIEFLFLAQANINSQRLAIQQDNTKAYGAKDFIELWQNKYEETYKKACILLADDPQFRAIKKERDDREEAERLKRENTFSKKLLKKIKSSFEDK